MREKDAMQRITYPAVSLVPTPDELPDSLAAEEGVLKLPEADLDYVMIRPEDRAYAVWDTTAIGGEGIDPAELAGIYTLRLEFFDQAGKEVTDSLPIYRYEGSPYLDAFAEEIVEIDQPLFFLHIDNRRAVAEIHESIEAGGTSTTEGCGFLVAKPEAKVTAGIKAYHPGGFLDGWRYTLERGARALPLIQYSGESNAGDHTTWFRAPNGSGAGQTVAELMNGIPSPAVLSDIASHGRRCTYKIRLEATALTRDGYGILGAYHAMDQANFALIEKIGGPGFAPETIEG